MGTKYCFGCGAACVHVLGGGVIGWGGAPLCEVHNQTQISADGADEVILAARQRGSVKSAVNPTSR